MVLFKQLHQQYPKDPLVLSKYGSFLHSQQQHDQARAMLYESIQLDPEGSHQNYMQLAELVEGKQSIECYQKGLSILDKRVNNINYDPDEVRKDIALTYSAMAEVYQTDLLHEKTSEVNCY